MTPAPRSAHHWSKACNDLSAAALALADSHSPENMMRVADLAHAALGTDNIADHIEWLFEEYPECFGDIIEERAEAKYRKYLAKCGLRVAA